MVSCERCASTDNDVFGSDRLSKDLSRMRSNDDNGKYSIADDVFNIDGQTRRSFTIELHEQDSTSDTMPMKTISLSTVGDRALNIGQVMCTANDR
jgi:hypothetical protein